MVSPYLTDWTRCGGSKVGNTGSEIAATLVGILRDVSLKCLSMPLGWPLYSKEGRPDQGVQHCGLEAKSGASGHSQPVGIRGSASTQAQQRNQRSQRAQAHRGWQREPRRHQSETGRNR